MRPASTLDVPTIAGVTAGGIGLVVLLVYLRFCGSIDMPPKPNKPRFDDAPEVVAKRRDESSDGYRQALEADALRAGITPPTLDDMERAFTWSEDSGHYTLAPGDPPVQKAGLTLTAIVARTEGSEQLLALVVENPGDQAVAYDVRTRVSSGNAACVNRTTLPHNGNVVAARGKEIRSECVWKRGMEIWIDHIESAPISAMNAFFLSMVPPQALGVDDRIAQGHWAQLPTGVTPCNVSMPQTVLRALEDGKTRWRDLADYYLRHPCGTYAFPDGYQAFTKDGEHSVPVTGL